MTQDEQSGDEDLYRPGYALAAERIINHIEQRGFQPGDRLPTEAEFAELLGVSRSIARDALKTLAAMGRVSVQRGRGIFVGDAESFQPQVRNRFHPTNLEDIIMLFEFRAVQERAAAELAAERATPSELMSIQKALDEYASFVPERSLEDLSRTDRAFHSAVNAASHNPFLVDAAKAAMQLQHEVVTVAFGGFSGGPLERALAEHTAIFDAVRRGDREGAGVAAYEHVTRTRRGYEEQVGRLVLPAGLQD